MKEETFYVMDYDEVDSLIEQHYGRGYEFLAKEEASNDSTHRFNVNGRLSEWDQRDVDKWVQTGSGSYLTSRLLNDLANKGVIPTGNYLIEVCW